MTKVVFLYGAPGVGKLTVAKELSKLTGFPVQHNHLTNDLVSTVYPYGTPGFLRAVLRYRLDMLKLAGQAKLPGVILTFVYAEPIDRPIIKKMAAQVKKYGGKMLYVHLVCDQDALLKRVKHPSRKIFQKIKTRKTLRHVMRRYDIFADVPHSPNLVIDNTKISPKEVAKKIKRHYKLG